MENDLRNLSQQVRDLVTRAAQKQMHLLPSEAWWRDKQSFLQSKGYMLRPRFRPGWVPSWTLPGNENIRPGAFEDYQPLPPRMDPGITGIDAKRLSDDRLVFIKVVAFQGTEFDISTHLSSGTISQDPRNHAVPLVDHFLDDEDPSLAYLIMPYLHLFDRPPLESVADVLDFINQMLEGLVFLHEQNVAHRDCVYTNVMMDADALFPEPFHPTDPTSDPSLSHPITPLSRIGSPIRYYYIDFGLSTRFRPSEERLVVGRLGRDQTPPELSQTVKYDPFKLDVYLVGNTFRKYLLDTFSNVGFMLPLITKMTAQSLIMRPTAIEAQKEWLSLRSSVSDLHRGWRLHSREEMWVETLLYDSMSIVGKGAQMGHRLFGWLSDWQG